MRRRAKSVDQTADLHGRELPFHSKDPMIMGMHVITAFHYRCERGQAQSVLICGSWSDWKEETHMALQPHCDDDSGDSNSEDVFVCQLEMKVGIHTYKYIVDGQWTHADDQQMMTDQAGNINNCVSITHVNLDVNLPGSPLEANRYKHGEEGGNSQTKLFDPPYVNQFLISGVNDKSSRPQSPRSLRYRTMSSGGPLLTTPATPNAKAVRVADDTTRNLNDRRLVIICVGLPARGKSFVTTKLARYLKWIGYEAKVFNIGSYRRDRLGSFQNHDFFRPDNPEGIKARTEMCLAAIEDLGRWLNNGGNIAILDGTNHTVERRTLVIDTLNKVEDKYNFSIKSMFCEIICNDKHTIDTNIQLKKKFSPDYKSVSQDQAEADFRARLHHYESSYETLSDKSQTYVKIFNVGQEVGVNRVHGYLPSRIVFFLMNLHIEPRAIYLSRHGESAYNIDNRIGGNPGLTKRGQAYASALQKWMVEPSIGSSGPEDVDYFSSKEELCVWSSTMLRAVQTASGVPARQYVQWKALEEIDVGDCDGLTYDEYKEMYPQEASLRSKDKLRYRYPGAGGESYQDLCKRLEPVIMELERTNRPLLVVSHRATMRCLFAYLLDIPAEDIPFTPIPLHTVIRVITTGYGTTIDYYDLSEEGRMEVADPVKGAIQQYDALNDAI